MAADMKIIHIAPTAHIKEFQAHNRGQFMALAHLCVPGSEYVKQVQSLSEDTYIILDNSYFELGESCTLETLMEAGKLINANCLVLPDGFVYGMDQAIGAGFDVMGVPKGPNMEQQFLDMMNDDRIKFVGLSYIHANAFGGHNDRHYELGRAGFLRGMSLRSKKIHLLGCISPYELESLVPYSEYITSMDTSMAVWYDGRLEDLKGKNPSPMDFDADYICPEIIQAAYNIGYLEGIIR